MLIDSKSFSKDSKYRIRTHDYNFTDLYRLAVATNWFQGYFCKELFSLWSVTSWGEWQHTDSVTPPVAV